MKKQYQISEFQFYDGEAFITFNLIDINTEKKEITVAEMKQPNYVTFIPKMKKLYVRQIIVF